MESLELQSIEAFVAMLKGVLEDAMIQLAQPTADQQPEPIEFSQLAVYSFRQTWPDASCGFGGIAAQVLTDAQTVVAHWETESVAAVYIRGELAYLIDHPNQAFWDAVGEHRLPGAAEPHAHLGAIAP